MDFTDIRVVQSGLQTSVQDAGRHGWEAFGVPRTGAVDFYAYTWANRLAGNVPGTAALEAALIGPTLTLSAPSWIAITGVSDIQVAGTPRPSWCGFWVSQDVDLDVRLTAQDGARAYIAVHGGIEVEPVMGSRSTDLSSGFGGYLGRSLLPGDMLRTPARDPLPHGPDSVMCHPQPPVRRRSITVRVVTGPRAERFPPEAIRLLFESAFRVSSRSDRVGIRLEGAPIASRKGTGISEPMPVGGIQVTPSGQPIVLLNDRGTIGGYPVLGTVISMDVWLLAQARPGDEVRFDSIDAAAARTVTREAWHTLYATPIETRRLQSE